VLLGLKIREARAAGIGVECRKSVHIMITVKISLIIMEYGRNICYWDPNV